jgi:hypothetical protein
LFRPAVYELLLLKMHLKRKCVIFNTVGVGAEGCLNIHFGSDCNIFLRYSHRLEQLFGRVVGATMMRSISSHSYPQRHHHEIRQPRDKHSQPKIRQHGQCPPRSILPRNPLLFLLSGPRLRMTFWQRKWFWTFVCIDTATVEATRRRCDIDRCNSSRRNT